eukprot:GHVT01002516.1.p1 GENE.GHVT01002516.1~~GHVT01002516.1.p1  ORF type:complete len:313 (+),score=30.86 GHVT01002516.1:435-1373(+)
MIVMSRRKRHEPAVTYGTTLGPLDDDIDVIAFRCRHNYLAEIEKARLDLEASSTCDTLGSHSMFSNVTVSPALAGEGNCRPLQRKHKSAGLTMGMPLLAIDDDIEHIADLVRRGEVDARILQQARKRQAWEKRSQWLRPPANGREFNERIVYLQQQKEIESDPADDIPQSPFVSSAAHYTPELVEDCEWWSRNRRRRRDLVSPRYESVGRDGTSLPKSEVSAASTSGTSDMPSSFSRHNSPVKTGPIPGNSPTACDGLESYAISAPPPVFDANKSEKIELNSDSTTRSSTTTTTTTTTTTMTTTSSTPTITI